MPSCKINSKSEQIKAETLRLLPLWRAETNSQKKSRLQNRLVQLNRGLVLRLANQYHAKSADSTTTLEDLEQVGFIGLLKALERYDPATGNAFSSLAAPWIRGEFMHYNRRNYGVIKVPVLWTEMLAKVNRLQQDWIRKGKQYSLEELATTEFGVSALQWAQIEKACKEQHYVSIYSSDDGEEAGHQITYEAAAQGIDALADAEDQDIRSQQLRTWMRLILTPVQQSVVEDWMNDVEPPWIAKIHGLETEEVSTLLQTAIAALKTAMLANPETTYA